MALVVEKIKHFSYFIDSGGQQYVRHENKTG
jgi:hypothetical protein